MFCFQHTRIQFAARLKYQPSQHIKNYGCRQVLTTKIVSTIFSLCVEYSVLCNSTPMVLLRPIVQIYRTFERRNQQFGRNNSFFYRSMSLTRPFPDMVKPQVVYYMPGKPIR